MEISRVLGEPGGLGTLYEEQGTFKVDPALPGSEGELLIRCTGKGRHPSRELARGFWLEVLSAPDGDDAPYSFVFWGRATQAQGAPRFVPAIRMVNPLQEDEVKSRRGDGIHYSLTDYKDLNEAYLDDAEAGVRMNHLKHQFTCPTCKRLLVLTEANLALHVFLELIVKDPGNGGRVTLDISRLGDEFIRMIPRTLLGT